jgi:hypothetical protein
MPNAQTIKKFYTTAVQKDFARLFQFRLTSFANIVFSDEHYTYVETASLPGRQINNVQVPYMGLQFNVPGTVSYPGSTGYAVTFRCDQSYNLRAALEAATFNTFDEANSTGEYSIPGIDNILTMELLNKDMEPVRYYTLFGAYIQSLADTAYDIKDTGAIATINATIAYQYWRSSGTSSTINATYNTSPASWGSQKQQLS